MYLFSKNDFKNLLASWSVVVENEIFVYKSGKIGRAYINKDKLAHLGVQIVNNCLRSMTQNAIDNGLAFNPRKNVTVLVIGPAYGAIGYPSVVAEYLADNFPDTKFTTGRTQLDENGKHYIPEKLQLLYEEADTYVIAEDIVNEGTTVREVSKLLSKKVVHSVICLADRGDNYAETLGVESFFPFIRVDMEQYDPRVDSSLFNTTLEINTILGKGKMWVEQFGRPPYNEGTDFSSFPLFEDELKQK